MAALKLVGHLSRYVYFKIIQEGALIILICTQGTPQFIQLSFPSLVIPKRISLTFQGGFTGRHCTILTQPPTSAPDKNASAGWNTLTRIYPEDVNRAQVFDLEADGEGVSVKEGTRELKIVFEESSDFFGRITVYDLRIEGSYP